MRFIDEAKIHIAGGHGGPGCVAFRREKFEPRGGPAGGNGGLGGSVVVEASNNLSTLQDFRYRRIYKAGNGKPGSGGNRTGADGESLLIKVPVGTVIKDANTGEVIFDFTEDHQQWVACKGGRGGKGNAHFATARFQSPRFAQPGEDGEARDVELELKLLADVAIIGKPNAGKSTLISRLSSARPRIADYPFTTRTPQLGVVQLADLHSIVIADIPGLIKNAHKGKGLGHQFLRHIERTRAVIHLLNGEAALQKKLSPEVVDGSLEPNSAASAYKHVIADLLESYQIIRDELAHFNRGLLELPEILCVNKCDLIAPEDWEIFSSALRAGFASLGLTPLLISAATGKGLKNLRNHLLEIFPDHTQAEPAQKDTYDQPREPFRTGLSVNIDQSSDMPTSANEPT